MNPVHKEKKNSQFIKKNSVYKIPEPYRFVSFQIERFKMYAVYMFFLFMKGSLSIYVINGDKPPFVNRDNLPIM